jgi:hypothetical protein
METTELFARHQATEAAYQADDMNLDLMRAADKAYAAFMAGVEKARKEWDALPKGHAKDSAEQNAFDTEGTDVDELYWFVIAIRTYEINVNDGLV